MKQRQAIARIDVLRADGAALRGTGVLVGESLVLTALHVVADRRADPPSFFDGPIQLTFPTGMTTAKPITGLWDALADWVILKCQDTIKGAVPLPLGELKSGEQDVAWNTFGFPDLNPSGQVVGGTVRDPEGEYLGVRAIQLFSDEAAAGNGAPVAGLSGAPCLIDGAVVGIIRSSLLNRGDNVAGTLFACPIALIVDRAGLCLPLPDPLRGLPGLPPRDLPPSPFRDLQPYGSLEAEMFFGRGREIRDLYETLTSDRTPPILLVYGQSGVGKSSLLEAGLFPRLAQLYTVRGARRDGLQGLGRTLDALLGALQGDSAQSTADAWRTLEAQSGRPIFVWLDQVEEAWTRAEFSPFADPVDEMADLLERCEVLFGKLDSRPEGKLILAFRKEYFPEIEASIEGRRLPFARCFVQPMGRQSVAEVVLGPTSTERLRRQFRMRVESGLEQTIAELACADRRSPVAPTLQIILTRLLAAAKEVSESSPFLSQDLLATIEKRDDYLADFLDRQLAMVAAKFSNAEQNGLLLDLLAFHTTQKATAEEHIRSEVVQEYRHLPPEFLAEILQAFIDARILTDTPGDKGSGPSEKRTRLVHDTLASRVRAKFDQSQRPGQSARRILQARVQGMAIETTAFGSQTATPTPLSPGDLDLVTRGRPGMRHLTAAEEAIVKATEEAQAVEKAEEARRLAEQRAAEEAVAQETTRRQLAERRTRNALAVFAGVVLVASIVAGVLWLRAKRSAEERAQQLAESIFSSAQADVSEHGDVTLALLKIAGAVETSPPSWTRRDVYISRAAHLASLSASRIVPLGGNLTEATISDDGHRVLLVRAKGEVELRDGDNGSLLKHLTLPDVAKGLADGGKATSPVISPSGRYAAALIPSTAQKTTGGTTKGTLVVAWDCASGKPWLGALLPELLAITPERVKLTATEDGWIIARLEAANFDLGGGLAFATSSAMLAAWQYGTALAQIDRPPDVNLEGKAMGGAFVPTPSVPTRVAFFPERDSIADGGTAPIIYTLATRRSDVLVGMALSKQSEARTIAWSEDGERLVIGDAMTPEGSEFELRTYRVSTKESFKSSLRIDQNPEQKQPVVLASVSSSSALIVAPTMDPKTLQLITWDITAPQPGGRAQMKPLQMSLSDFRRYLTVAADGRVIIAFSDDDRVRMLDRSTGRLLRPPVRVPTQIARIKPTDSGRTVATISLDGVLLRWMVGPEQQWEGTAAEDAASHVREQRKPILGTAFMPDLSAIALISQGQQMLEVGSVTLLGNPPNVGRIQQPADWTPLSRISTGEDAERFPDFHAIALNSSKQYVLAARSHIGQLRERIIVAGNKPCTLSPAPDTRLEGFTDDGQKVVACSAQGCQLFDTATCALTKPELRTIPSTTLGSELLAMALSKSRRVTADANQLSIDFGKGGWRTAHLPGAVDFVIWIDGETGLEIAPPREGTRRSKVLSVSGDGRTFAVTVSGDQASGQLELGAWDSITRQALTVIGGASWPPDARLVGAVFSSDGQWLYALSSDGTLRRQWILARDLSPDWVSDAIQAITGYRLIGTASLEPLDDAALRDAKSRAVTATRNAARNGDKAASLVLQVLEP